MFKSKILILGLVLAFGVSADLAFGIPADLSAPASAFGDADRDGTLMVSDDLRQADFGGGLRLPVRWVYHSSNQATDAYGWDGFSLTMLEAKAVKVTTVLYEVTFLCGKTVYFSKQPDGQTPQWKSNDGQWGGTEDTTHNKFTVTRWDGWVLEYQNGRIKKLVTDDNRTLVWCYDSTDPRLVTAVKEPATNNTVVSVGISSDNLEMAGSSAVRGAHTLTVNGDVYTFNYAGGTLQDIEYPDGRKTQWRFEDNGTSTTEKRLTLTGPAGSWKSWVFFVDNRRLKTDDTWNYTFTGGEAGDDGVAYSRPTMQRTRIATGETEKIEYESSNSIEKFTDLLGGITKTYSYKSTGVLYDKPYKIERKRPSDTDFTVIWRASYDAEMGDLLHTYDTDDHETTYAYERFSGASIYLPPKKVTVTDPLGRVAVTERDEDGNPIKTTSASGVVRNFDFDSRHRVTRVKNANGDILIRYVYGDKDELLEVYDALGNETTYEYETHLGVPLLKKMTTPEGRVTEWTHDSEGRVSKIKKPSTSEWQYTYSSDFIGVADKVTDPLGGETDYVYNDRLNSISVTDPLGHETETEYNDLDLPQQVTDALNRVTQFVTNGYGDLTKLTDPRGKIYLEAWESDGLRKKLEWPDAKKEESAYDIQGRLLQWTARGGDGVVTNSYNDDGELSSQSWTHLTDSGTISLTRNSGGQIESSDATTMSLTVSGSYSYNTDGLLSASSQTVGGVTRSASLTYDLNGRIQTVTYPKGFVIEYVKNDDGQITAIKKGTDTLASYGYDSAGRLTSRTLSSGVVTTYAYDTMDRVTSISVSSGTSVLWAERYGYNAAGQRTYTLTGGSGTVGDAYWFDAACQLRGVKYGATGADAGYASASTPASLATWDYDAAGNRETQVEASGTTAYSANCVNQYTAVASTTPSYNNRGDLAALGDWEYAYDATGNLLCAHNTSSNLLAKYWRDATGRRAVKEVDGAKEILFNLGDDLLEAYDVQAATAKSYVYEPGIDRPLAQIADDGTIQFLHQDVLGNVRMLTDASGTKYQTYDFTVWGKVQAYNASGASIAASQIASRWLFTGREYDGETGFYHFRGRAYSPDWGRFLQNDPIGFAGGGSNFLAYCQNDPINLSDPLGLCWGLTTQPNLSLGNDAPTFPPDPPAPPTSNTANNPPPGTPPPKPGMPEGTRGYPPPGNPPPGSGGGGGGLTLAISDLDRDSLALVFTGHGDDDDLTGLPGLLSDAGDLASGAGTFFSSWGVFAGKGPVGDRIRLVGGGLTVAGRGLKSLSNIFPTPSPTPAP